MLESLSDTELKIKVLDQQAKMKVIAKGKLVGNRKITSRSNQSCRNLSSTLSYSTLLCLWRGSFEFKQIISVTRAMFIESFLIFSWSNPC